ncbi:MAG: hypothetical protein ACREQL_00680 [Candidatus Binatia bacterium]
MSAGGPTERQIDRARFNDARSFAARTGEDVASLTTLAEVTVDDTTKPHKCRTVSHEAKAAA